MQRGLTEAGKKRASFSVLEKRKGEVTLTFLCIWNQQWTSRTKQGPKLIHLVLAHARAFLPAHHTEHKEVVACSTNNGQNKGPAQSGNTKIHKYTNTQIQQYTKWPVLQIMARARDHSVRKCKQFQAPTTIYLIANYRILPKKITEPGSIVLHAYNYHPQVKKSHDPKSLILQISSRYLNSPI